MVVGGLGGVRASSNEGPFRQLQVYSEVLNRVNTEYVEEPNIPKVTDGALHGLLEALDPNSQLSEPQGIPRIQGEEERCESRHRSSRIQAIWLRCGDLWSSRVVQPTRRAFRVPTSSKAIEGHSTRECRWPRFALLLSGQPGSNVNISVVACASRRTPEGRCHPGSGIGPRCYRQDGG